MISVIIPTLNEQRALPATLAGLARQCAEHEVIVADGGSEDETREIVRSHAGITFFTAPKGRASQMNAGAARARGDWLLFLHADTLLPEDALTLIENAPLHVEAGGFRHRFSGPGWPLRLVSLIDNIRCTSTKVVYGDQAMFIRRSLFHAMGGFPPTSILEDVYFCEALVKQTTPVILDREVVTDSRKFEQMGVWQSFLRCSVILVCVSFHWRIPRGGMAFFSDVR